MMEHAQTQFITDTDSASGNSSSNSICDVFSSLQDCISAPTPLQPLATYASQLQTSQRDTMSNAIDDVHECITPAECARLLGYNDGGEIIGMNEYLQGRNWTTEQGKQQGQEQG